MQLTNLEIQAARAEEKLPGGPPKRSLKGQLKLGSENTSADDGVEYGAYQQDPSCRLRTSEIKRIDSIELKSWLEALIKLHCAHASMQAVLQTASRVVANMLNLEHCSIAWRDENDSTIRVRVSYTREGADVTPDQAVRAISNVVKRKRPKQNGSSLSVYGLGPDGDLGNAEEITAPLRLRRQIVGYVYGLRGQSPGPQLSGTERALFFSLSQHISAAIEAQVTREMLDCPYVALALNAQKEKSIASLTPVNQRTSVNAWEPLARNIARRFFRDLRRAGFETKQVLFVATEIIDSLNEVLRKYAFTARLQEIRCPTGKE